MVLKELIFIGKGQSVSIVRHWRTAAYLKTDVPGTADVVDEDVSVVLLLVEGPAPALANPSVVAQDVGVALQDAAIGLDSDLVAALHFCGKSSTT